MRVWEGQIKVDSYISAILECVVVATKGLMASVERLMMSY
jgi:hypothetical protein